MIRCAQFAFLAVLLATLPACREAKVTSYRVPKEKESPMPSMAADTGQAKASMASTGVPTASGADLVWTAPSHWRPQPGAAMRKGSYVVPGTEPGADGDMSITAFPGDVGGPLANLNRWRTQIELPALTEAAAAATVSHIDSNGLHFDVVDYANDKLAKPQRVLGAMVPFNGSTWFFKLSGPDALVAKEKPAFLQVLNSVRTP